MIILNMIVKNEAHCIRKCLDSLVGFVDRAYICDTGSTDGTVGVILKWMNENKIEGDVKSTKWVNFGHNRNEALEFARSSQHMYDDDYIFFIDADEHIINLPKQKIDTLTLDKDGYYLNVQYGVTRYTRTALVRGRQAWKFHGAVHEYVHLDNATMGRLEEPAVFVEHLGARSRDPDTYKKDAEMLLAEHKRDPNDVRTVFYLAQSYRDNGDVENSIKYYSMRSKMGGWIQEVFFSLYQLGLLYGQSGDQEKSHKKFIEAYNTDPTRAEPLVSLSRSHRLAGEHSIALVYADWASKLGHPGPDALFVNQGVYSWEALDEVAVNAFYVPNKQLLGRFAAEKLVELFPNDTRMKDNLEHYKARHGSAKT